MTVHAPAQARLGRLVEGFLDHIVDYRDYSPATARAYEADCARLIKFLGDTDGPQDATKIRPRDIRLFLPSLSNLSAASTRRTLYGISSFFRYLVEMEIIDANPAAPVDPPKVKRTLPEIPSKRECAAMLECCDTPTESGVIGLLMFAGLRRSEVLGLDVADVAADLSSLRIDGKGGIQRVVPVCTHLREILNAHLSTRTDSQSPALLLNRANRRMQPTSFYRIFRRVLQRAGLEASGITPHAVRHFFASELVRMKVDIATISELLGHSNIATTSIYLHTTPEIRRDAVDRLDVLRGGHDVSDGSQEA